MEWTVGTWVTLQPYLDWLFGDQGYDRGIIEEIFTTPSGGQFLVVSWEKSGSDPGLWHPENLLKV